MLILIVLAAGLLLCLALTPIAGKVGRFQTNTTAPATVNHEFENWTLGIQVNLMEANGYEQEAISGLYWNKYLQCLAGGEVTVGGLWNTAKSPTISLFPTVSYTSVFCGITNLIGFAVTGQCERIEVANEYAGTNKFKSTIKVEGLTTYPIS